MSQSDYLLTINSYNLIELFYNAKLAMCHQIIISDSKRNGVKRQIKLIIIFLIVPLAIDLYPRARSLSYETLSDRNSI